MKLSRDKKAAATRDRKKKGRKAALEQLAESFARIERQIQDLGAGAAAATLTPSREAAFFETPTLATTPALSEAVRRYTQSVLPAVTDFDLATLSRKDLRISSAMDPRLQVACARRRMGMPSRGLASATSDEVAVIAKVTDTTAWEALSEVRIGSTLGAATDGSTLVTARIPVSRIEAVRGQPFVRSLKASQPLRRSLASTTEEMGTRPASHPPDTAPDGGAGVVIGIADFGCDFAHRNFRNADGSTRLIGIWDQGAAAQPDSPFGYGRFYNTAQINLALKKADPYKSLGYGPPVKPPGKGTHGTHVMDIAAGNGLGTGVPGNAPKADLLFVEVAASDIAWTGANSTGQNFGDSVQMLEAVKFIFDQAADRPCVVNLSLGTNGGPHDGTTLVEQGLDAQVLARPNRAVVLAASNSFADGIHAAGTVPAGGSWDLAWQTDVGRLERELEIWLPGNARIAAEILTPNGVSAGFAEPGENLSLGSGNQLAIFVSSRLAEPNNNDNTISIYIAGGVSGGEWTVRLHSRNAVAAPFHAWIERQDAEQSRFSGVLDNSHTIGSISCGKESIAVGSFDAHKAGKPISYFSSAGPTRDGREKPEISAPGHAVVAARSRSGNGTTTMSGTSMAAPAVTGLVALLLAEAARRGLQLSSTQLRSALFASARRNPPSQAAGAWDPQYGLGRAHIGALSSLPGTPPVAAARPRRAKAPATERTAARPSTRKKPTSKKPRSKKPGR